MKEILRLGIIPVVEQEEKKDARTFARIRKEDLAQFQTDLFNRVIAVGVSNEFCVSILDGNQGSRAPSQGWKRRHQ